MNEDSDSSSDSSSNSSAGHVVTIMQMLQFGLELFYAPARIGRAKQSTNLDRFNKKYGVLPVTACSIYEELQTTGIAIARIDNAGEIDLKMFLISLHFLRKYPTEDTL